VTWATLADAREPGLWPDAASIDDATLTTLLDAAGEQCVAYAPALADGDPVPARYVQANVQAARDLWGSYRSEGDTIGLGDFGMRRLPLAPRVKLLLRPRAGLPAVAR
jgi:hypothetical protein